MTLYGLPMLQIHMPHTTTLNTSAARQAALLPAGGVVTTAHHLSLDYIKHVTPQGAYYTVEGEGDAHIAGGRPIAPRISTDVQIPGAIAHGALLVGGTFSDTVNFDPVVSRIVTEETYIETEPDFPSPAWEPAQIGAINRFLSIEGKAYASLVIVPGQFRATTNDHPTVGIQRLYTDLQFEVYHAPFTATDFIAPNIWNVRAISSTEALHFEVWVDDNANDPEDTGEVARVVVLYRYLDQPTWSKAELTYLGKNSAGIGIAEGNVAPITAAIEYFVQAVDDSGNVMLALDHGMPFTEVTSVARPKPTIYLPLVLRGQP